MTVGEKIQKHRKNLGLSQEELGQRLLVSRQTISLWEKDQTVPTIDNLIGLSDIFGTTVDEILDVESNNQYSENQPNEAYRFTFSKEELNQIHRLQMRAIYKRPITLALLCVLFIVSSIETSAHDIVIGFAFGMLFIGSASSFKGIRMHSKVWKHNADRICKTTYEYNIFDDHININLYRENKRTSEFICSFTDIEQIQQLDKWLFLQFGGQTFILRKNDLKETSAFYSFMYKHPSKTIDTPIPNKWRVSSIFLFIASLLSILGAVALTGFLSSLNGLFTENMWVFFLMTPIPIASIVFGFILKSKGYKYKKNIITGVIMNVLLCIYGSFVFIF